MYGPNTPSYGTGYGTGGYSIGNQGNPNTGVVPPNMPGPYGQRPQMPQGGWLQGYAGPMPGSPEFQAARAAGQHPLLDWFHSQHPNWQGPQGGLSQGSAMTWQAPQNGLGALVGGQNMQGQPFGGNTLTAYFGLLKIGQPKEGETVVVSGAAGSTGSMAAQIARIKGCKVIGIAGGKAKCDWLLSALKLHGAIDYRSENVAARLKELAPKGVDVFYDNVGGTIMQDVIDQMAMFGRVAVCGQIAEYNSDAPAPGPRDMFRIVSHRLKIQGLISADFMGERNAALADLTQWAQAGELIHRADVREGFKKLPTTYFDLFNGGNTGTLMLKAD